METKDTKWLRDEKEAVTYVFSSGQDKKMVVGTPSGFRSKIWQIVPVVCASLSCLPFGLMLGWPSPTNPMLLKPDSAIPITIDQSAMIAGFLMIGNTLGTPLSTKCFMESKYGILLGVTFMTVGWFLMWQARDIYWLLGSRILVGFGGGYCSGQLKLYIKDLCDDNLKTTLTKQINLYTFLAFVAIHSFGPFFNFRDNSIISLLVTIIVFFILLLLPSTPKDLIKARNLEQARKLILYVKPSSNVDEEINKIVQNMKIPNKQFGMRNVLAHQALRNRFLIFAFLVFCQQFSGAPATLIYTQILFEQSNCPYAVQFAISYALTFFFSNVFGIYLAPKYNKRRVLLISSFFVILSIIAKICIIFFRVNETHWSYSSVPVMYLFIISHTVGLGNIPFTLIVDFFPKEYHTAVTKFFVMFHSMLALIVTKIFQVLMSQYDVGIAFCLFLVVSVIAFIFIFFILPNKTEITESINIFVKNTF